jgi:DNA-binding NtrC family response regulator
MAVQFKQVLIVDDRPQNLAYWRGAFWQEDFCTNTVNSAGAALERLEHQAFDALVSNVRMPVGIEGIELTRTAKDRNPSLPVILYTLFGTAEEEVLAFQAGADDYIVLPLLETFGGLIVLNAVRTALEGLRVAVIPRSSGANGVGDRFVAASPGMKSLLRRVHRLAVDDGPVLIMGESGTGKELIARALHAGSGRAKKPFLTVNCGGVSASLADTAFFGSVRGAFTGAHDDKPGLIEAAEGGTLFLDELGELPEAMQTLLLRFLDGGEFRRVGENRTRYADVRIISATNRRVDADAATGRFRYDLFWRLAREVCHIPPLRDRPEDLAAFVSDWCITNGGGSPLQVTSEASTLLLAHTWPGNLRELRHVLERAARWSFQRRIDRREIEIALQTGPNIHTPVDSGGTKPGADLVERGSTESQDPHEDSDKRTRIERALVTNKHRIGRTAASLGISRATLYRRMKKHGLHSS